MCSLNHQHYPYYSEHQEKFIYLKVMQNSQPPDCCLGGCFLWKGVIFRWKMSLKLKLPIAQNYHVTMGIGWHLAHRQKPESFPAHWHVRNRTVEPHCPTQAVVRSGLTNALQYRDPWMPAGTLRCPSNFDHYRRMLARQWPPLTSRLRSSYER